MNSWNYEITAMLNKIRLNSTKLSNKHRNIALQYQRASRLFDLPIIVMSTFSSSIGNISYITSLNDKSMINLFISICITILTSIKLYLNITSNLNNEILLSREFYILSIDIFKNLNLRIENRQGNGNEYLNECYNNYIKLCEKSNLSHKIKKDELLKIDQEIDDEESISTISSNSSSSSLTPRNIILTEKNIF
jgi:hypothetical protein